MIGRWGIERGVACVSGLHVGCPAGAAGVKETPHRVPGEPSLSSFKADRRPGGVPASCARFSEVSGMRPSSAADRSGQACGGVSRTGAVDGAVVLGPARVAAIVGALSKKAEGMWRTQRSAVRHAVLCRGLIWPEGERGGGDAIRAQLVDLSCGGVGLLSGAAFEPCERLVFEMTVEGVGPVQWTCRVRWCERTADGIHRVGAQFVDVHPPAG